MAGIFPEASTAGGLVIRDGNGATNPANVQNAYVPATAFTFNCDPTALPSNCTARIFPSQINGIVSELYALGECFDPDGNWDCASNTNLCRLFTTFLGTIDTTDNQQITSPDSTILVTPTVNGNQTDYTIQTSLAQMGHNDCAGAPIAANTDIATCANLQTRTTVLTGVGQPANAPGPTDSLVYIDQSQPGNPALWMYDEVLDVWVPVSNRAWGVAQAFSAPADQALVTSVITPIEFPDNQLNTAFGNWISPTTFEFTVAGVYNVVLDTAVRAFGDGSEFAFATTRINATLAGGTSITNTGVVGTGVPLAPTQYIFAGGGSAQYNFEPGDTVTAEAFVQSAGVNSVVSNNFPAPVSSMTIAKVN